MLAEMVKIQLLFLNIILIKNASSYVHNKVKLKAWSIFLVIRLETASFTPFKEYQY